MTNKHLISEALELIKSGQPPDQARELVKQYLESNPEDMKIWSLLYKLTEPPEKKLAILKEVLFLDPDIEWAKQAMNKTLDEQKLSRAVSLAKSRKRDEARRLVDDILKSDPENMRAWHLKSRLAKNRGEEKLALDHVLRLSPDHENARQQLNQLQGQTTGNKGNRKIGLGLFLISISSIFLLCIFFSYLDIFTLGSNSGNDAEILQTVANLSPELSLANCQGLVSRALEVSDSNCQTIGNNQICYGNVEIAAELIQGANLSFDQAGDSIPINSLEKIITSPLDLERNVWGVAVLKLQANLPGTVPGQNVTFLIFGDTAIANASGDMSSFYFTTGLTGVTCNEIDFDGLLIEMPDGAGFTFQANGVEFTLQGNSVLEAQPNGEMTITMLDGTGQMVSDGQIVELGPGSSASVPLGEDLQPSGPISDPVNLPDEEILFNCQIYGYGCPTAVSMTNTSVTDSTEQPTNTSVPVASGQPTNTPVPLSTNTPAPTATITNTLAPGQPTNTSAVAPTNTSAAPTNTSPAPTSTSPPPPTNTSVPAATCSDITVSPGATAQFNITNNYSSDIVINSITITWNDGVNGKLNVVRLGGQQIASPNAQTSPITISPTGGSANRTIAVGTAKVLALAFQSAPVSSGYQVDITFDGGWCTQSASQ